MAASAPSGMYVNMNSGAVQAGLMPFRNALINGDMRINQRGTSTNLASLTSVATASPGSWVADRWNVYRAVYAAGGVIGQGNNLTNVDLPFSEAGIKTFGRIGRLSGNTATNAVACAYNMESQDCYKFVGKTVTLSFYYRTGTNFSGSILNVAIATGTGTDQALRTGFTGQTNYETSFQPSTTWRYASYTTTLSSALNQIALNIQYTPVGTAGPSDYFDITGIQLELGSVPTSFEVRPYPLELYICQRYYVRFGTGFFNVGYAYGSGGGTFCIVNFPNRMRIVQVTLDTPAGSTNVLNTFLNAPTGFLAQYQGSAANDYQLLGVAMTQWSNEAGSIFINFTASTSVTAGLGRSITIQTNYYIGFSAEL